MRATAISVCILILAGCGESTDGSAGSTGAATGTTTGDAATTEPGTTAEPPTTGAPDTGSTAADTEPPGTSSGSESTTAETGETGTTGGAFDCDAVSAGPFAPTLLLSGFQGSEDLAFDGQGGLVLKRSGEIVIVRADQSETVLAQGLAQAYGTRYLADGRLLVALPGAGDVIAYDARGQPGVFVAGLTSPNGIYPDLAGDVWITEFGGSRVLRVGADLTTKTIVTGAEASSANGVVYDPQRQLLFYTKYQAGQIQRVVIDGQGEPGAPELVAAVAGAALDGLTLDACGNIYAIDQKNSRLYRARLDGAGAAIGEPALLAEFPSNVANAQFGVGEGFDPHTLYVAGNPGDVYTLVVEFPGAATVTVQ
jgi:sugar lactone lactonase YvrE